MCFQIASSTWGDVEIIVINGICSIQRLMELLGNAAQFILLAKAVEYEKLQKCKSKIAVYTRAYALLVLLT